MTKELFANSGSYQAQWGLTDLYADSETLLRAALQHKEDFDTGWFGCKKEIHYARISRIGTKLLLEVTCHMDDGNDIADTLIWEACGGNSFADSGWDALDKSGFETDETKHAFIDHLLNTLSDLDLVFDDNTETLTKTIGTRSFDVVLEALSEMESACELLLQERYKQAIAETKTIIENWRHNA